MKDFIEEQLEPSPWLQALKIAHECEHKHNWEGAEKAYKQACVAEDNSGLQSGGFLKLSAFYSLQGRSELALDAASKAVEVAETATDFALSQALHRKAGLCLTADQIEEAEQLITRLLECTTESYLELMHYFGLLLHAQIALKKGQCEVAQADLSKVWEYIEPQEREFALAGYQNAIGDWWSITAKMHAMNGDTDATIAALREEVKRRRIVAQLPQLEGLGKHNNLARSLWKLGTQLEAANDSSAKYAFNESRSIRESIGLSGDFS